MEDKLDLNSLGEKTQEWIKQKALELCRYTTGFASQGKVKDKLCWKYYNGTVDDEDYEYLNKEGNEYLPAKVRSMNILRTPVNLLVGHQSRRDSVYDIFVNDTDGKREKYNSQLKKTFDAIYNNIVLKKAQIEFSLQQTSQQIQELQQFVQAEATTPEQQQQQQMVSQQLPTIMQQIGVMEKQAEKVLKDVNKEVEHIVRMYITEYKDVKEEKAFATMEDLVSTLDIQDKTLDAFIDKIVSGKEYIYVDIDDETQEIIYKNINSLHVYFSSSTSSKYIQNEKWVGMNDIISYDDAIMEYGESKLFDIEVRQDLQTYSYPIMNIANSDLYQGHEILSGISRTILFFRAPVKRIKRKTDSDIKLISTQEAFDNKEDGALDTARYDEEIFKAVILNGKHVVYAKKKKYVYKDPQSKRLWLPVVGETFVGIYRQPFSLIWQNKDFQEMYRIVNHYKELMIAVAGVKGQIVDVSQRPGDMSPSQQRYHRKRGSLYIETMKKGQGQSPYNQWKEYDDSISASIQYVELILQNIIETCFMLMGTPRQRLGITVPDEAVGNAQLATEQSSLVTEILHHQHDFIIAMSYKLLINLVCEYKNDEDLFIYKGKGIRSGMGVKIPKGIFKDRKFDIYFLNSMKNEKKLDDLRMLAMQHYAKNQMALHDAVQFYNTSSMKELEINLRSWSEKAEELAQANQEQQIAKMEEIEKMKIELPKQIDAQMQQAKNELEQYKIKIDEARLGFEERKSNLENELKKYEIDTGKELKMTELGTEREIEGAYLQEQQRTNIRNEQLQGMQLELNAIKIKLDSVINKISADTQKIAAKQKLKSKEHIKD